MLTETPTRETPTSLTETLFDERIVERNRTVLVTGGTGYIGRNLVRALLKRGFILHLLVRENSRLSGLEGCNFFLGDLTEPDSIRPALENCAYVFHLAANMAPWSHFPAELDQVNVQAWEGLLQLCGEAGVKKVVQTSSFVVFGPSNGGVHAEESRYNIHPFNDYDRTKIAADEISRKFRDQGLAIASLYPTLVYGSDEPTQGNLVTQLIRMCLRGFPPGLIAGGEQKWSFVHVDDVVAGHISAMRRGPGGRYILGGENASVRDFLALVAEQLGRKKPRLKIPLKLARVRARIEALRARWGKRQPWITPEAVDMLAADWVFSSEKAQRDLNYQFRQLAVGLQQSVEWLRQNR